MAHKQKNKQKNKIIRLVNPKLQKLKIKTSCFKKKSEQNHKCQSETAPINMSPINEQNYNKRYHISIILTRGSPNFLP